MFFVLQTLIVSSVGFLIYYLWLRRRFYKVWYQMPGPFGLPFIGIGLKMFNPDNHLTYLNEASKHYKTPFITFLGPKFFLYVNDPITMEAIFNSPQCINKGDVYKFLSSVIGDGLFTSSSPRWNKHRRLIDPAFRRPVLNDLIPIFNAGANSIVESFRGANGPTEISQLIGFLVLQTACRTTAGKKIDISKNGWEEVYESYHGFLEVLMKRILKPWLYPDFIFRFSKLYKQQKKCMNVIFGFIEKLIRSDDTETGEFSKQILGSENDDECGFSQEKSSFVELIRVHVEKGNLSWDDFMYETTVVIAGAFDTTATTLYFVCLCLALHPEYQEKLYEELVKIFPNRNNTDTFEITQEHLERMTYVEMIVKETLRLFAPVPMVSRKVSNDFKLPNGVTLPAGTEVILDIYNMQRSEKVWGLKAKQFCPESHFGENKEQSFHPFAFAPFTKGLRMCIGNRYSSIVMKILVAKIFRNFFFRVDANLNDLVINGTVTTKLKEYPLFEITKRKN